MLFTFHARVRFFKSNFAYLNWKISIYIDSFYVMDIEDKIQLPFWLSC